MSKVVIKYVKSISLPPVSVGTDFIIQYNNNIQYNGPTAIVIKSICVELVYILHILPNIVSNKDEGRRLPCHCWC